MDYKFLFKQTKERYEKILVELKACKQRNKELAQINRELKEDIRCLKKGQSYNQLPILTFVDRRVEQRRKKDIPVKEDRRSGQDRRQFMRYIRPEFQMIFNDFYPKNKIVHPIILKSDSDRILDAYWELWHVILGYDLRKIEDIRKIYLTPEIRDEIINEVEKKGFCKKGISVSRSGGGFLFLDSIFVKDPENRGEYYVFIIIDKFQEE